MEKNIKIDEKAVYEAVRAKLDKEYDLVYIDYRDEIPASLVQECLNRKEVYPLTEKDVYSESREYSTRYIIDELLKTEGLDKDQIELFRFSEEYDQLRADIQDRDVSTPEKDLLARSQVHGYLFLNSNYDCWIDIYDQGGLYFEGALQGILSVLSLNPRKVKEEAVRQGVAVHGRWPDYTRREGREVVAYDKFVNCLFETPGYGNWCFFGVFDGETLWDNNFDTDGMTITKGTTCAMFNSWNGGGSLTFCETLRDLPLEEVRRKQERYSDGYRVLVDEASVRDNGYTPGSVYGQHLSNDIFLN